MAQPVRCSRAARDEPLLGSALTEQRILIVEQPGAWGRDPVAALAGGLVTGSPPCRVVLARHPDRSRLDGTRRWWSLARDGAGIIGRRGTVEVGTPVGPEAFEGTAWAGPPTVFICTNGRRDACCAEFGRALVNTRRSPSLWEASHLGGHRFAPTGLRTDGLMVGRVSSGALDQLLAGDLVDTEHTRGRTGRTPQEQIAEWAVREHSRLPLDELDPILMGPGRVEVGGPGGRRWIVDLAEVPVAARAKSCGASPEPGSTWATTAIVSSPDAR